MMADNETERKIKDELDKPRVVTWTNAIKGFAFKSNRQMELYARDFPEKGEAFKDIISFFNKFGDYVSEERLVHIIRSVQKELGHVNFNMPKLAGIKQYMKFYERQK